MHARSRYDLEEAQSIYKHVGEFMSEVASALYG